MKAHEPNVASRRFSDSHVLKASSRKVQKNKQNTDSASSMTQKPRSFSCELPRDSRHYHFGHEQIHERRKMSKSVRHPRLNFVVKEENSRKKVVDVKRNRSKSSIIPAGYIIHAAVSFK